MQQSVMVLHRIRMMLMRQRTVVKCDQRSHALAGRTAYPIDFLRGIRSGSPLPQSASDASEDTIDLPAVGAKLTHKSSIIENPGRTERED